MECCSVGARRRDGEGHLPRGGSRAGDSLIAGWTTGKDIGVILYSVLEGATKLQGSWAGLGDSKLGREQLER